MSAEALLREIRAELRSRGLERRPTGRVLAELGVHTALLVAGLGPATDATTAVTGTRGPGWDRKRLQARGEPVRDDKN